MILNGKIYIVSNIVQTCLQRSLHRATDATFVPKYASEDIIRSGHLDYNTLFASNEQQVRTSFS